MNMLLMGHYLFITAAFISFAVSFGVGIIYLSQESRLKTHRPTPFYLRWAPALEVMDSIHYKILIVGFVLLSTGMILGAILSKQISGIFLSADPRRVASLVTWAIYALFLNVRIRSGWRGRRGILLSLLGFLTVALTYFGIHH